MTIECVAAGPCGVRAGCQKDQQISIAGATLHLGDCLAVMRTLADNSVDAIVTDPPYGLSFMGKKWDYDVPSTQVWAEALRVLKPGGHLLAFAGTRTQHRMAVRIEDAGFEIRDMIAWVYGSGFPKSLDVSKAIDKAAGAVREVVGTLRTNVGMQGGNFSAKSATGDVAVTAPATEAARQWQGWGTALKPALEPITVARKPLIGTVASNVLAHGTGALNIDGCRVATDETITATRNIALGSSSSGVFGAADTPGVYQQQPGGRWPANLIHDGSADVVFHFPQSNGQQGDVRGTEPSSVTNGIYGKFADRLATPARNDTGSAARFFYTAKASADDRDDGNIHPTVKPTDLMAYLIRLVTPPGGIVLDCFMGSGSTGKAAALGGFQFVGIERDPAYFAIARARITAASAQQHLF